MADIPDVRWVEIPGTNGLYKVSTLGEVARTTPYRLLKNSDDSRGYFRVNLSVGGKVKLKHVAHAVLEAFVGARPEKNEARHLDGNPKNNRLENLAWGTKAENMQDALRHGTFPVLERRPGAKLSRKDAIAIFTSAESTSVLAKRYGVGVGVIRQVKTRETWASVTAGLPDAIWQYKPKISNERTAIAVDPTKTRAQAMQETGLSFYQVKRLRKEANRRRKAAIG